MLITIAASLALVTARLRIGRGGALIAVAMFLGVRVLLAIGVDAFERVGSRYRRRSWGSPNAT